MHISYKHRQLCIHLIVFVLTEKQQKLAEKVCWTLHNLNSFHLPCTHMKHEVACLKNSKFSKQKSSIGHHLPRFHCRSHAAKSKPIEIQKSKIKNPCRSKEYKIKSLQTEVDRIVAKERQEGGLTQGQASTLARNEQVPVMCVSGCVLMYQHMLQC